MRVFTPSFTPSHTPPTTCNKQCPALFPIHAQGDIGTSPMYALTAVFSPIPDPTEKDVLGGISLIFWAQTLIVLVKYVLIVLHANDHGEGE